MSKMSIGDKITYARKKRGLSQKQLAAVLRVSNTQMNHWEKGGRNPKMNTLAKICRVLEIREGFFTDSDEDFDPDLYFEPIEPNTILCDPEDIVIVGEVTREDYLRMLGDYIKRMSDDEVQYLFEYAVGIVSSHRES